MAYTSMKKLIGNKNAQLASGLITEADYTTWKEQQMNKLDLFLTCNRLTEEQYSELVGMLN